MKKKKQETVIYDKVWLNEGKADNQKTGEFTVPVGGVYSFNWKTLTNAKTYFVTEIVHNRNPIKFNHCDGRGISTEHVSSSSQTNIKMKKGEKVWIRVERNYGSFAHGGYYSNFSGYKI